jgi:hypothetical protein
MTETLIPTDEQLVEFFNENDWNYISPETFIDIARSVLECWGHPTPQPAPLEVTDADSKLSASEQRAVIRWVEDHIDTNKAVRSWRDVNRGGLLMAEVHTVQPRERPRSTSDHHFKNNDG